VAAVHERITNATTAFGSLGKARLERNSHDKVISLNAALSHVRNNNDIMRGVAWWLDVMRKKPHEA